MCHKFDGTDIEVQLTYTKFDIDCNKMELPVHGKVSVWLCDSARGLGL